MNMCPSRKIPPESWLKGQVFFLCSNEQNIKLAKEKLCLLGGRVDEFLSRDITTVLVDDYHLAAYQCFPTSVDRLYLESRDLYNLPSTSQGYHINTAVNLAYRVINFAIQFGIPIWGIAYFLTSIDTQLKAINKKSIQKRRNQNLSNLTGIYIKFECEDKKFRPCFKIFSNDVERLMPLRNATVLVNINNCTNILQNFSVPKQVIHFNSTNIVEKAKPLNEFKTPLKPGDKKTINKVKPKEESNYCECCRSHYNDIRLHLKSANHLKFVLNDKNYEAVAEIVKHFPNTQEFIAKHVNVKKHTNINTSFSDIVINHQPNNSIIMNTVPASNICTVANNNRVSSTLFTKEAEDMPLDLHVETLDDTEMTKDLTAHSNFFEHQNKIALIAKDFLSIQDPDFDLGRVKSEPVENLSPIAKNDEILDENSLSCQNIIPDRLHNQAVPGNVTNSTLLNEFDIDKYFIGMPDEEKDIYFDEEEDIFESQRILDEYDIGNISPSPKLASCASSLPLQSSINIPILMNSAGETKDVIEKSGQSELEPTCYKVDTSKPVSTDHPLTIEKLLSHDKVISEPMNSKIKSDVCNITPTDPFNTIPNLEASRSLKSTTIVKSSKSPESDIYRINENPNPEVLCSNLAPEKSAADKMFSDDSEDEVENNKKIGDSFICNVLDIITSSEGENKGNDLNMNEPASSDSGLKMDSKPISIERNSDPEKEISTLKRIASRDNSFTNVIKRNIGGNCKMDSKMMIDDAIFPSQAKLISNRVSISTDENSRDIDNAYDSGFTNGSIDFDAKSIEKFPRGQNLSSLAMQTSTYSMDSNTDKSFPSVLNASLSKPLNSIKTIDDILSDQTKCAPQIQGNSKVDQQTLISKPINSQTDLRNFGCAAIINSTNCSVRNAQMYNMETFNSERSVKPSTVSIPNHPEMKIASEKNDKPVLVDHYDKFKRSSHAPLDLKKDSNSINKMEIQLPVPLQNTYPDKDSEKQNHATSLIFNDNLTNEFHAKNTFANPKNCGHFVSGESTFKNLCSLENNSYRIHQNVVDVNTNCPGISNYNLHGSDLQTGFKLSNRDHTVHIPKKRYFSTISKELDLRSQQSSVIQYGPVRSQASTVQLENNTTDLYVGQNLFSPIQEDAPQKQSLNSNLKRSIKPAVLKKRLKLPSTKRNIKTVKRKQEATRRRIPRKCEIKHSSPSANSSPEIYVNESKPKMNLYTSYRLSQSKTLPNVRMPPKKSLPKLKKLPSVWRVTKIVGSDLKFKFTCIQPESFRAIVSCDEYEFNE